MTTAIPVSIVAIVVIVAVAFAVISPYISIPDINIASKSSVSIPIGLEPDEVLSAVNATILEVVSAHAWDGHGTEVNDAIRCLNNHGSTKSFITYGFVDGNGRPIKTNLWLCQEGNDWFAIVTTSLEKVGGNRIGKLITAYLVDKSKFLTIQDYITAVVNKWSAREIAFIVEAGNVFLQPK